MLEKIWRLQEADASIIEQLMTYRKMPYVVAKLLAIRGIETEAALDGYFNVSRDSFHDPFLLKDMAIAVKRVLKARDNQEAIYIYGDYDVDGVTSTSVLYMFLDEIGCQVHYYIPDRHEEGYGINEEAISKLKELGASLMISVDTGITAVDQVAHATEIGLDVIITDHHECQEVIPRALAVINPKQAGDHYPFDMLAGVGVTFKLIQAIARTIDLEPVIWKYLDIVAVGTVADIVPLKDENRVITRLAFESMPSTWNLGLKALMKVSDIEGKKMTAGRIGFGIGPRLNAAGRIRHAKEAVELFIGHDAMTCMTIAEELDQVNKDRQSLERKIFDEAVELIESRMKPEDKHIIVVASENWHHGVIGIVASKLVERYYRPIIILAIEDGIASGSARSVEGFSIFAALSANKDLFNKFGGHEMAAGMSLNADKVKALDEGLNSFAKETMTEDTLLPKVKVDMALSLSDVNIQLIEEIQMMEPFGMGNREPSFICRGPVKTIRKIGKEQTHLKVDLGALNVKQGVAFGMAEVSDWLKTGQEAECVCTLDINEWKQMRNPQLMIKDIRHTSDYKDQLNQVLLQHKTLDYMDEGFKLDQPILRDDYAGFFRHLKSLDHSKTWSIYYAEIIEQMAGNKVSDLTRYLIMLEVFSEVGLLSYELKDLYVTFELIHLKKVALSDSKLYNKFL